VLTADLEGPRAADGDSTGELLARLEAEGLIAANASAQA
jgi:hypothetical protein